MQHINSNLEGVARPKAGTPPCVEDGRLLSDDTKRAWLRLIRTPYIGGVTFWELLAHFGSAETALAALPEFVKYGSRIPPRSIPSDAAIGKELEQSAAAGLALVAAAEPLYPKLLKQAAAPPPLLYMKGDARVFTRPPLAIVGSRHASAAGLKLAAEIAAVLGGRGFLIVSGLARGIDASAHRASLPFGTCAVLAGGLDAIYPPEHAGLATSIAESGVLMGECPPGFVARSQDFPRRNRIISGCSLGVVVVEAAERSGSLITARLAAEQNREVFAVPGHPYEPRAAGTNRLIKEGAMCTTCPEDIEEALRPLLAGWERVISDSASTPRRGVEAPQRVDANVPQRAGSLEFIGEAAKEVLNLLSFAPTDIDDICRITGLEARQVSAALLSLDLSGQIERRGLRQIVLRP